MIPEYKHILEECIERMEKSTIKLEVPSLDVPPPLPPRISRSPSPRNSSRKKNKDMMKQLKDGWVAYCRSIYGTLTQTVNIVYILSQRLTHQCGFVLSTNANHYATSCFCHYGWCRFWTFIPNHQYHKSAMVATKPLSQPQKDLSVMQILSSLSSVFFLFYKK